MSGSKLLRLCSLFLCLLLCLANFSVVANAAEVENLVDSNMSNWVDFGEDEPTLFQKASVTYLDNDTNYISVSGSKNSVVLFDLTEFLKIGESYQFSFFLPNTEGLNNTSLNSCKLSWFLCDGSGDVYPTIGSNVFEITIDNSNKDKFLGNTTTFEFTYTQGFKNTYLCFGISPGDNVESYNYLQLYIANVKLERLASESEKKLDGILGWLQELWNSITNGFSELGDRISGYFDNLILNIQTFFDELPGKIFNYQIDIDGDGSGDINSENLIDIKNFNFKGGSNFTVTENSDGSYYFNLLSGTSTNKSFTYGSGYFGSFLKDHTYRLSFKISDFSNTAYSQYNKVKITVKPSGSSNIIVFEVPYDSDGVVTYDFTYSYDYEIYLQFILGRSEFVLSDFGLYDITNGLPGDGSSGSVSWFQYLINKFTSWFDGLGESIKGFFIKLVDDIKGLFIPPDGFFEEWKVTFDLMLSDNLGFIYQAPNFVIDIVEVVEEILQSDQEVNLVFPAVEFDIAGYHIELFKDTKVDFSFLEAGIWFTLYSMYKVMLYVIFSLALIKYGMSTWERTMAN